MRRREGRSPEGNWVQKTREGRQEATDSHQHSASPSAKRGNPGAQGSKWLLPETSELVGREALLPLAMSLDGEKKEK